MKKYLYHISFSLAAFFLIGDVKAQNVGITTPGTTSYPQTIIGNTLTEASNDAGNFLTVDQFTTTVPFNAIAIKTFGSVNSGANGVKVAIYADNGSNFPGALLFTEVVATTTANTSSTITIPNTFLPAGKYWLAFNMNSTNTSANFVTKSTNVVGAVRKFQAWTFGTAFPNNPATGGWSSAAASTEDHIAFVGVPIQGYAKATKISVGTSGTFTSISFYTHAAGSVRLAIYSDNGSGTAPLTKQWESTDISISVTGQPKLTTVNISTGTPTTLSLNAGIYWLVWQWNTSSNGPSYTAGAANSGRALVQAYGSFPASWSGGTSTTENWTEFISYCTPPTVPGITGVAICSGTVATLVASNALVGSRYLWYDAAIGGTLLKTSADNNDNTYTTSLLTSATNYWVSIVNASNCESSRIQVTVTINPSPVATVTEYSDISCFNGNDGSITIAVTPVGVPYYYSVDNGLSWTINASLPPYIYGGLSVANNPFRIKVKDNNGCVSK